MVYQIKYHNNKKGFSILEVIIVLAIFAVIFSVSNSVFNNFKAHSNLELTTNSTVEALRLAGSRAQSGKNDSKWGVEILSNQIVIFKGDSYLGRDASFDEVFSFPGGISGSGLGEIVFEKLTGGTMTTGNIILTNNEETKNININAKGTVTY